jgi:Cdc6-like AAA superfamily ATPase
MAVPREQYLTMSLKERIVIVESLFIVYPFLKWCLEKIDECQQFSKLSAEPQCLLITGETGVGKITLSKMHEAKYPRLDLEGGTVVPVLRATIPIPSTSKTLVTTLLNDLGDPNATTGSTHVQTLRLVDLLIACKTELIILDEFQHFIDRDSEKVLAEISDWLKNLIDKWKKPIILMGLPQCIRYWRPTAS